MLSESLQDCKTINSILIFNLDIKSYITHQELTSLFLQFSKKNNENSILQWTYTDVWAF